MKYDNAVIEWASYDIGSLKPEWSEEKCQTALDVIKKQLQELSIQYGWGLIENLLFDYREEIESRAGK